MDKAKAAVEGLGEKGVAEVSFFDHANTRSVSLPVSGLSV